MRKRFFCGAAAVLIVLIAVQRSSSQDISNVLELKMTLSKQEVRVGDELLGHFAITNVSDTNVSIVSIGWLYMAYWFRVDGAKGSILAEPLFEKLFTPEISREDVITLQPGQSFTVDRDAKIERAKKQAGKIFVDFGDSGFYVDCGQQYQISGLFWAREDRSGQFKLLSGRLRSRPVNLWVAPCK
jgi:hypothetical protein